MKKRILAVILSLLFTYSPVIWATLNGMWIPMPNANANQGPQANLIDASAEKIAFIGIMSKTCTLNKLCFLLSTVTTGDTLKLSFQNVDLATGDPDGVVDQFATVVIADTDDNKWICTDTSPASGLVTSGGNGAGSGRSVTIGDIVAGVVEFNSFVAGSLFLKSFETTLPTWDPAKNIYFTHFTTAWTKFDFTPAFAMGCDDGTYQYMESVAPYTGVLQIHTYNSGSVADEIALHIKVPFSGMQVSKGRAWTNLGGDAELILYAGTTVQGTPFTLDKDLKFDTARRWAEAQFADLPLTANTDYYLALKPTSATDITLNYNDVGSNAILDVVGGRGWLEC